MSTELTGLTGRVTVPIEPGHTGEVIISVEGSSEAFSAITEGEDSTVAVNSRVVVIEQPSARTVVVARC